MRIDMLVRLLFCLATICALNPAQAMDEENLKREQEVLRQKLEDNIQADKRLDWQRVDREQEQKRINQQVIDKQLQNRRIEQRIQDRRLEDQRIQRRIDDNRR